MPKPKTGRPPGRPKNEVAADAHAYVRMSSMARDLLERAVKHQMDSGKTLGARITVSSFMLDAAIQAAMKVLGEDKP